MSTDTNPRLADLARMVARLEEALRLEKSPIVRDSAIKRFELSFDLAWKCIQTHARKEGLDCHSPRSCIKTAFKLGLIKYEDVWLEKKPSPTRFSGASRVMPRRWPAWPAALPAEDGSSGHGSSGFPRRRRPAFLAGDSDGIR